MENIELLKKIEIFSKLNSYETAKIGKLLKNRKLSKGEHVVRAGEEGQALFIIKKGAVRVLRIHENGKEELLSVMGSGEHFGEIALLDMYPRSADVVAEEDSELLEMKRDDLDRLLANDHSLAARIYKSFAITLGIRLRGANENLMILQQSKG